ncbi:MAG: SLBB domain-containing protein [Phycisphaerales bacterium]|nr:SLBB domain-containing protein [Phycisphaerales bacterium]
MSLSAPQKAKRLARLAGHGVVGAGGAGFPAHVKLAAEAECIILNAAECEPLLHKDKEVLRHFTDEVLEGLRQAAELVGARDLVVGVKGKYEDVIEHITPRLPPGGRIVPLTDSYPSGDEFILVYDVTGRVVPPGGLPLAVGCVVINVETALNIAADVPVTTKFLTVAGAVQTPCTVRVPVGITFREVVALAGGATVAQARLLSGGAMMGQAVAWEDPIPKTCGGLLVLPQDHFLVRRYDLPWKAIAQIGASACDQCSFCTEFCPRYLLGHPLEPHKAMRALGFVENLEPQVLGTQFCCECNLCTMMACPEDLDPKNVCTHNKRALATAKQKWQVDAHPYRAALHLDNRRVPISRLIHKLGLRGFRNEGPLVPSELHPVRVQLPLKQHAGPPARPVVVDGDRVHVGDCVAEPAAGALGATVHASIGGVCRVLPDRIEVMAAPGH